MWLMYLEAALVVVAPPFILIAGGSVVEWFMERRDRG